MTQGYVLTFRPSTGNGTIITDQGASIRFANAGLDSPLTGGDVVAFDAAENAGDTINAETLQIIHRAKTCHSDADTARIRQFLCTVRLMRTRQASVSV